MCLARRINAVVEESPGFSRRELITRSGGIAAAAIAANTAGGLVAPAARALVSGRAGRTQVQLLGSCGGQNREARTTGSAALAGTSVLIAVDGVPYLLDAGIGCLLRLNEAGYGAQQVRRVLMTHHHPDHNGDLGSIANFAWTSGDDDPSRRLGIHGPQGTRAYFAGYRRSLERAIEENEDGGRDPSFADFVRVHEFAVNDPRAQRHYAIAKKSKKVVADGRITVHAKEVFHGRMPSVAYRIQTPDLDIVFSGDRGPGKPDHFIDFARGADILFHEIYDADVVIPALEADPDTEPLVDHMLAEHADPTMVGNTATGAGVPTLVLYHLTPGTPQLDDKHWRTLVEPYYAGEIIVGRDSLAL